VDDVHRHGAEMTPVDVRSPDEFESGHSPGAMHVFLPSLPQRIREIPTGRPIAVYCGTGYRASLAASLLQKAGLKDVATIPGNFQAWQRAGYEVGK
jgi:hydroxyacylglutathione hydrolase